MGKPILYEYGNGVYSRPTLSFIRWALILCVLFGASAAAPHLLHRLKPQAETPKLSTQEAETVKLLAPVPETALPVSTNAIVDTGLQTVIEHWAEKYPQQQWGVAVERLGAQRMTAHHNAIQPMYPASLYKLYLVQSVSEKYPFSTWAEQRIGSRTVLDCVDIMIKISDNDCGEALGMAVGWPRVDSRLRAVGLTGTKLNSEKNRYTTAADVSLFLQLLYDGKLTTGGAYDQVLNSMKAQKYNAGIPRGAIGCETFNKTGDLDGFRHDAAIVRCGELVYTLVIMSKGGSNQQMTELSKLVNNYLFSRR